MKRVFLKEEQNGRYALRGFGVDAAGADGRTPFHLVIESKNRDLKLEFPETCLFDLFTHFDLRAPSFRNNDYHHDNFLRVKREERECVVEASSGTLYDFFKERAANGRCALQSILPLAFYWKGNTESDAA